MSIVKIGVVGIGRIGKMHSENIGRYVDKMQVTAVADIAADQHKDWLESQNITDVYTDYNDMIENADIDAVLISASTNLHYDVCIAAAAGKKHVFCEKPIEIDVQRAQQMIDSCEEAGVKLQIGFQRRFDHSFRKVRNLVEDGTLGDPHILRLTSRDSAPPSIDYVKVSGGLFMDMTIHDFDLARYLSMAEVEEISVIADVLVDEKIGEVGDVDTALTTMRMSNGALVVIDNSRKAAYGYDQRAEVFGSKGQATAQNEKGTTVELSTEQAEQTDKIFSSWLDRYTQAFSDEFNGFADCIINDTKPIVDGTDGLRAVQVALAAGEALKTGRPVKVKY